MYYFAVLTYPGGINEQIQNNLLHIMLKFDNYIIVKEYGKSTVNPHLNVVYNVSDSEANWSSNAHKFFRKAYPIIPANSKNLIRNKKCTSPDNVIGGYLQKEDLAQILINKGFDLEACKLQALDNLSNLKKPKVTLSNAHDILFEYCDSIHDIDYNQFLSYVESLIREGYDFTSVLTKLKQVYVYFDIKYQAGAIKNHLL